MIRSLFIILAAVAPLTAAPKVTIEQQTFGNGFVFEKIASPATNDLGATAKWQILKGNPDRNGASLSALHDGKVPVGDDKPRSNFFFASSTNGGLVHVDLSKIEELERITSYSRHFENRGPQIYDLYGSKSDKPADAEIDLKETSWVKIASIDTRNPKIPMGGRHAASITGKIGSFRQLIFDVKPTETRTPFGLTFFSEIDLVKTNGPELKFVPTGPRPRIIRFATKDQKHSFIVDATEAPQYTDWVEKKLKPVIIEWYPKLVELLPGQDYQAPATVTFTFKNDVPAGVPAYATGSQITMNAPWFKNQLDREAKGCVIHELVHVVQNYWLAPRLNPNPKPTPSWITEGIADYIRWFLYEPESRGAHYAPAQIRKMKHDASYRISANFINWVSKNHKADITRLINEAARNGRYEGSLWKTHTGLTLQELSASWKAP